MRVCVCVRFWVVGSVCAYWYGCVNGALHRKSQTIAHTYKRAHKHTRVHKPKHTQALPEELRAEVLSMHGAELPGGEAGEVMGAPALPGVVAPAEVCLCGRGCCEGVGGWVGGCGLDVITHPLIK